MFLITQTLIQIANSQILYKQYKWAHVNINAHVQGYKC